MEQQGNNPRFPEQHEPRKVHGTNDDINQEEKEKYIRDSGKIEDYPEGDVPKMNADIDQGSASESSYLTDRSGEEKKEDYINTDERKRDLDKRGS